MIPKRLEILLVVVSEIFLCYWIYWYSKECLGTVGIYRAEMQMLIGLITILVVDNIFFLLWEKKKVKRIALKIFAINIIRENCLLSEQI